MYLGMPGHPGSLIHVALCVAASVYLLTWLPTCPWLAYSILSVYRPGLHFLVMQTMWDPHCGVSRQKEP